jgi:hypothetical protein
VVTPSLDELLERNTKYVKDGKTDIYLHKLSPPYVPSISKTGYYGANHYLNNKHMQSNNIIPVNYRFNTVPDTARPDLNFKLLPDSWGYSNVPASQYKLICRGLKISRLQRLAARVSVLLISNTALTGLYRSRHYGPTYRDLDEVGPQEWNSISAKFLLRLRERMGFRLYDYDRNCFALSPFHWTRYALPHESPYRYAGKQKKLYSIIKFQKELYHSLSTIDKMIGIDKLDSLKEECNEFYFEYSLDEVQTSLTNNELLFLAYLANMRTISIHVSEEQKQKYLTSQVLAKHKNAYAFLVTPWSKEVYKAKHFKYSDHVIALDRPMFEKLTKITHTMSCVAGLTNSVVMPYIIPIAAEEGSQLFMRKEPMSIEAST